MSRLEYLRGRAPGPDALNQRRLGLVLDAQRRAEGDTTSKGSRAEQKRDHDEQFMREFPRTQFNRELERMLHGAATEESIKHVFGNPHRYGRVVEGYKTEKGSKVTITIVDFTPHSTNLP